MGFLSTILTAVLLFAFVTSGTVKLCPAGPFAEGHAFMVAESSKWMSLPPMKVFGTADVLLKFIGGGELLCALLLVTPLHVFGNLGIIGFMSGAVYTHVALADPAGAAPSAVLLLFGVVRLYLATIWNTEVKVVRMSLKKNN